MVYAPTAAVLVAFRLELLALIGGLISLGLAMAPDQDQRVPGIKHRGITHTVHFALLVGTLLAAVFGGIGFTRGVGTAALTATYGFVIGFGTISSHIAADALTPMGIEPFRNGRRYSFDLVKAANPVANYLLLAFGVAAVGLAFVVGTAVAGTVA